MLPLLKIRFAAVVAPLLVLALWRSGRRSRRQILLLAAGFAATVGAILLFNHLVYDNPLKYHHFEGLGPYARPPASYARGLLGVFFDCAFGLFAYAPIWMLLLPAGIVLAVRRHRLAADFLVIYLPYLFLLGPLDDWFGAWAAPFPYGIILLPLLGVALIPLLESRRRGGARILWVALGGLTLVLTLLWVALPGWTYNLAHGRNHLLDHLSTLMGADVARFFPSSIRLRGATWIWPPLAILLVSALWWRPRRLLRAAGALGSVGLLLAGAGMIVAAHRLPTTVLEFEDPFITKTGGQLYPALWTLNRPRFRGGWALPAGTRLSAPVVAGGRRTTLRLDYRAPGTQAKQAVLVVRAGQRRLAQRRMRRNGVWRSLQLDLGA